VESTPDGDDDLLPPPRLPRYEGPEAHVLAWYKVQGWEGLHAENSLCLTLFGAIFSDILNAEMQSSSSDSANHQPSSSKAS
jgi:hypothetical protein